MAYDIQSLLTGHRARDLAHEMPLQSSLQGVYRNPLGLGLPGC